LYLRNNLTCSPWYCLTVAIVSAGLGNKQQSSCNRHHRPRLDPHQHQQQQHQQQQQQEHRSSMSKSEEDILVERLHIINRIAHFMERIKSTQASQNTEERSALLHACEDYVVRLMKLPDPSSNELLQENKQVFKNFFNFIAGELAETRKCLRRLQNLRRRHKNRTRRKGTKSS
jgi:hypothetical protein